MTLMTLQEAIIHFANPKVCHSGSFERMLDGEVEVDETFI